MYKVENNIQDGIDVITLINTNSDEYVKIFPRFGGNLVSLKLNKNNTEYEILDGNRFIEDFDDLKFKGAKLFPYPNRIKDGKYVFMDKQYQLPINHKVENNAIHGLVYNKPFQIVNIIESEHSAILKLEYIYEKLVEGYPFSFILTSEYVLSNSGIEISTRIKNTSNTKMPMGDGWHPYFTLNEIVDNLYLEIPSGKRVDLDKTMMLSEDVLVNSRFDNLCLIEDTKLDDCFYVGNNDKSVTKLYSKQKDLTINLWQDTGNNKYNYLQIYTSPNRKSIAIEPVTCHANAFNNGFGLIILHPDEVFGASFGINIS